MAQERPKKRIGRLWRRKRRRIGRLLPLRLRQENKEGAQKLGKTNGCTG